MTVAQIQIPNHLDVTPLKTTIPQKQRNMLKDSSAVSEAMESLGNIKSQKSTTSKFTSMLESLVLNQRLANKLRTIDNLADQSLHS